MHGSVPARLGFQRSRSASDTARRDATKRHAFMDASLAFACSQSGSDAAVAELLAARTSTESTNRVQPVTVPGAWGLRTRSLGGCVGRTVDAAVELADADVFDVVGTGDVPFLSVRAGINRIPTLQSARSPDQRSDPWLRRCLS